MAILDDTIMTESIVSCVWSSLGSVRLTVWICLALAFDLALGYACLHGNSTLFSPMNEIGLMRWAATYGRSNVPLTAWFFILLGLLFLLCVNSFTCTTNRVAVLIRTRGAYSFGKFMVRLAPHGMHYAMIVILLGYLASYVFSTVHPFVTLVSGSSFTIPRTTVTVSLVSFTPRYYTGDRLDYFKKRVIDPVATLKITSGGKVETRVINGKKPVHVLGHSLFLTDFSPKKKGGGMSGRISIVLSIRKDPGVTFYMAGLILFSVGLGIYMVPFVHPRNDKKEKA